MKIIQVTYTTTPEFAAQNRMNIELVMGALREQGQPDPFYTACTAADGKTFIHTAFFNSEEGQRRLSELPAFKAFQEALRSSGPEVPPKQEILTLVGSSQPIESPER